MRPIMSAFSYVALVVLCADGALAQGNAPPTVSITRWRVGQIRTGQLINVYDASNSALNDRNRIYNRSTGTGFLHEEGDIIFLRIRIIDPDWATAGTGGQGQQQEQEQVSYAIFTDGLPYRNYPPVPTPIPESTDGKFVGRFRPAAGVTFLDMDLTFSVPEFIGKNQARLRGEIDWDCRWFLQIAVSNNEGAPQEGDIFFSDFTDFVAIENPSLDQSANPPPFADAGADQTVAAGTSVTLDASRTFDSFNQGFDTANPNTIDKDQISYAWEFISGPVRVDPVQSSQNSPTATVVLNEIGQYEYRVTVDDNANDLPSVDTVVITVVDKIRGNHAPIAKIIGPGANVIAGNSVTLDGSSSSDPDGDALTYRWRQTDELGGELPLNEVRTKFQALSGLTESKSNWQALVPGTYYFRLLVSDGQALANTTTSITVVDAATGGITETADAASSAQASDSSSGAPAGLGACGAGLFPLAAAPLAMLLMRRRR
ncbi:MAG: PKD domain-containing protein [Phycisphaerae bacterium]